MKMVTTSLDLIRKDNQFRASVSMMIGDLDTLENKLHWLHPEERNIYAGYRHDQRKKSYLLGRYSAKQAIADLNDLINLNVIYIDRGVFDFPIVKGTAAPNIQVSISHSDDIGVSIAYPEAHPMGIDIERVSSKRSNVVRTQLTEAELKLSENLCVDPDVASVMLFSIKESLSKVVKTGMMLDFRLLEVASAEVENTWIKAHFANFGQYKALAFYMDGYVCSIVSPKRTVIPRKHLLDLKEQRSALISRSLKFNN